MTRINGFWYFKHNGRAVACFTLTQAAKWKFNLKGEQS